MRARAIATAILLFVVNLLGYGFGPLFIGAVSDVFFVNGITELGVGVDELARNQCHPKVIGLLDTNLRQACSAVYARVFGQRFSSQRACTHCAALLLADLAKTQKRYGRS